MKINMLRYILVLVPEVPGGGGPSKSLAGHFEKIQYGRHFQDGRQVF